MALVNVNRKNTDQFYRYKMPKLIAKVEGKGNGIKTVIVNMSDVAKALSRPPSYPTKYFGCELGAQTQIDSKNERYIVNGAHQGEKLQEILDGFIEKFVLCSNCENPETVLKVDKKERIGQSCRACGHQGFINLQHRLITYICKNPPSGDATATPSKKDKKDRKNKKHQNGDTSPNHSPQENGEVDKFDMPNVNNSNSHDDDEWSVDTSDAAVHQRMKDLSSGVKGLTFTDDLERPEEQRFNMFYQYVKKAKQENSVDNSGKDFVAEAERLDVKDKAVLAMAELLFDCKMLQQIPKYRLHFLRFVNDNPKAQKYLLGAFEMLVGKSYPEELMPKSAHILKAFYDNDILDEEVLINWSEKVSKKYVTKEVSTQIHDKVKPFIDWLKQAEEEESSGEEEDDEDDLVYDNKAEQLKVVAVEDKKKQEEEDDEINIDDI
ncbi:eukaryotic translation initiation factor 5 [Exaiptasia diaphana]|uniref:Eukaryotic translation initiation factor 5 n=1 Tax=Exaiptasia diaphana TaxID=2652724 RepID=A0A913XBA9_EXADI|nr:eukaryotic translation initiation factor 5 [Exaiptasia diaphana]KXJ13317.1 Eukaryotic translation initiation factor 5 [Exaiptasia diaphana]